MIQKLVFVYVDLGVKILVFARALPIGNGHSLQTKHFESLLDKLPIFESAAIILLSFAEVLIDAKGNRHIVQASGKAWIAAVKSLGNPMGVLPLFGRDGKPIAGKFRDGRFGDMHPHKLRVGPVFSGFYCHLSNTEVGLAHVVIIL